MSESEKKKPQVRFVEIGDGHERQRLDNFLVTYLKGVPKSHIYRILRKGEIRVNKGRKKADYRLIKGDVVRIPPIRYIEGEDTSKIDSRILQKIERSIVFEDERLLVINKPSGIAVHGGSGLSFGIIEALRRLKPAEKELELVHRLDRDTSGCLLVTKKRSALRVLHTLMRENRIDKRYIALVRGSWKRDRMEVNEPLLKNTLKSGERVVRVDPRGKPASTRFVVRARFTDSMLVEAQLLTGRTHQIRVHAAHLGTPILGDEKYGDAGSNREMRKFGLRRLFLHAESLCFPWPDEKQRLTVKAELEPALEELLKKLGA